MDLMKSRRLSMRRRGYTTPHAPAYVTVDACWQPGYAAQGQTGGEGVQEAGASPARSRHCNRGANPKRPPPQREGRVSRESGDWPFARDPKPGRGPREGDIYGEDPRAETPFDPAAVEPAYPGSIARRVVRPPLGQRGPARTTPGAGRGPLRLPARVRPRRATPARRSLPLGRPVVSAYLRRGMAAGLLAGLLAGLFAFLVGEPILDRAIALEEASAGAHHEEVFSRPTQ